MVALNKDKQYKSGYARWESNNGGYPYAVRGFAYVQLGREVKYLAGEGDYDQLTILEQEFIQHGLTEMLYLEALVGSELEQTPHYSNGDMSSIKALNLVQLSPEEQNAEPYAVSVMKKKNEEADATADLSKICSPRPSWISSKRSWIARRL
jgi:hypothetical protein